MPAEAQLFLLLASISNIVALLYWPVKKLQAILDIGSQPVIELLEHLDFQ
jgi:hypothetical protein